MYPALVFFMVLIMKNRQGSKWNEELGGNRDKKLLMFSEARQVIISTKQGKINIQFIKGPSQIIFKICDCKNDSLIGKLGNKYVLVSKKVNKD